MSAPQTSLPFADPQFWIVTAIALVAAAYLVWKLAPRRLIPRKRSAGRKRATLTIGGRPPGQGPTDRH